MACALAFSCGDDNASAYRGCESMQFRSWVEFPQPHNGMIGFNRAIGIYRLVAAALVLPVPGFAADHGQHATRVEEQTVESC